MTVSWITSNTLKIRAHHYDAHQKSIELNPDDKVCLLSTKMETRHPSKNFDWKRLGPFEVLRKIRLQAYKLQLPPSMKIHVFHVSLLDPYQSVASTIPTVFFRRHLPLLSTLLKNLKLKLFLIRCANVPR